MTPNRFKLRAWDKKKEIMFNLFSVSSFGQILMAKGKTLSFSQHAEYDNDRIIIMQSTGLLDKNGKEIFESDIVNTPKGKFYIQWNQLHCEFGLFINNSAQSSMVADWINQDCSTPRKWEVKEFDVIGNIYEHAHLLND